MAPWIQHRFNSIEPHCIGSHILRRNLFYATMVNLGNAASKERWDVVMKHVLAGTGDIESRTDNSHDSSGMAYTALLHAAYFNMPDMFSWLVQHGANPQAVDTNSKTALHVAAKYGSAKVVRQLLMEGVSPTQKDRWGRAAPELTTDRRGIVMSGGKTLTTEDLKLVDKVFQNWPNIKSTYEKKGLKGLEVLATLENDLAEEALEYLALEECTSKAAQEQAVTKLEAIAKNDDKPAPVEVKVPVKPVVAPEVKISEKGAVQSDISEVPEDVDVFLSYCWADKGVVRKLAADLKEKGYKVWIDVGQLGGGDNLYEEIDRGIRQAKCVITSVSPKYAQSVNCRREVNLASDINKPIIPVIVDPESKGQWPPRGSMGFLLAGKLYVDISEDRYENGVEQLKDALGQNGL